MRRREVSPRTVARADANGGPRDVVFTFSYETWSDAKWRGMMRPPERILTTLMTSDEVGRLLVADPWRWWPTAVLRRATGFAKRFPVDERRRLHSPLRWERSDPTDPALLDEVYAAYDRDLEAAAARFEMVSPAVITTSPVVAGYAPLAWADGVTYFGRDDWLSSPARRAMWPAYREAYRRIAASGMGVTAVSQEIIDRIAPTGPHAVIPNGVQPAEWLGEPAPPPTWFDRLPAPRAVYVGTIDSRVDIEGVVALANRRPDLSVVLIGPIPSRGLADELRGPPNVAVHGPVGRAAVVAILRAAELSLLAHRRTDLTRAMSPLKVYEYLAAGLPVLATDLPPVRGLGDRVLLLDEVADFADAVDDALQLGRAPEDERVEFVHANSWASRHQAILDITFRGRRV